MEIELIDTELYYEYIDSLGSTSPRLTATIRYTKSCDTFSIISLIIDGIEQLDGEVEEDYISVEDEYLKTVIKRIFREMRKRIPRIKSKGA